MKFGSRFLGWYSANDQLEWGILSEECGFDFCWFSHDTFLRSSWPIVCAAASHTKRIKLPIYTSPYTVAPDEIATMFATLDELSKGRAVLSLGHHTTEMLRWVGIDAKDPVTRTREAVELIRRCLASYQAGKAQPFNGKEFTWTDQAYLRFKPFRERPPIYVSAHGKEFLHLCGEIGDGATPMMAPPESASYVVNEIREGCRKASRDVNEIDIAGFVWISVSKEDPAKARNLMKRVVAYFAPFLRDEEMGAAGLGVSDFRDIRHEIDRGRYDLASERVTDKMLQLGITGTISECIERIAKMEKAGVTQVSLGGPLGPDIPEAIRTIGKDILPPLRSS
jgi:5,10-methylenetetrahydromethanopterin reductase